MYLFVLFCLFSKINILKIKRMKRFFKNFTKPQKISFWVCLLFSIGLLTASFVLPPTGKIDPSVIQSVGEIFGFAALYVVIEAIGRGSDIILKRGDTEVKMNNPDKVEDEK